MLDLVFTKYQNVTLQILQDPVIQNLTSYLTKNLTLNFTADPIDYSALSALLNRTLEALVVRLPNMSQTTDYENLAKIIHQSPSNTLSFWKEIIDYFIEHDYNITHKVYGQPETNKRFSVVGYLESVLLKVAHQIISTLKAVLHDIIEPIFLKFLRTIVSLTAEIVTAVFHVIKALWTEIKTAVIDNPELVRHFSTFVKWVVQLVRDVSHVLVEHLVELNEQYKVVELVLLFVVCVRYLRGYVISAFIVAAAGYHFGYERVTEHTIIVILIVIFSFIHFLFPDLNNGYY